MKWFLRNKIFLFLSILSTLPFLLMSLSVFGGIKNEDAMILILPFVAGLPWNLVFLVLPFDIPGMTSAGIPDVNGNLYVLPFHIVILMLPVYVNIYLLMRLSRLRKITGNEKLMNPGNSLNNL